MKNKNKRTIYKFKQFNYLVIREHYDGDGDADFWAFDIYNMDEPNKIIAVFSPNNKGEADKRGELSLCIRNLNKRNKFYLKSWDVKSFGEFRNLKQALTFLWLNTQKQKKDKS